MHTINFRELESMISYDDYTAFVYDDGTQIMYSGGDINEDTMDIFYKSEYVEMYDMNELPDIKGLMQENLLAEFEPAGGVKNDSYNSMAENFENGRCKIAKCISSGTTTYMLVWCF